MTVVSYAQNFEDVMLLRALGAIEHGVYIDVGAQDPVEDSVTKLFYERGWRGINIEPVASWHDRLVVDRPADVNLRVAVGTGEGELTLYEFPDTGLSTTDAEFAQRHLSEGRKMVESVVRSTSLDAICNEQCLDVVHFLKIDVEGAERAVLEGFSFTIRPWIVLVEATLPNTQIPTYSEWEHLLTGRGYRLVYQDGLNRFYLDDAHSELEPAFASPPNVFDRFVRFSEWRARTELHLAHEEHRRLAATQNLVEARERAAAAEAERNRLLEAVEELRSSASAWSEVAKSQEDTLAALRSRIAELKSESDVLGEQLRCAVEARDQGKLENDGLRERLADLEGEAADQAEQLLSALDERYLAWLEVERLRRIAECVPALEAERSELAARALSHECELAALRYELQRMLESRSWRLTRPLRGVRRRAARAKAGLRRAVVALLRATLALIASWAPMRAIGRLVFAGSPQLRERMLRLSGRLPVEMPPARPCNPKDSTYEEPVLTPRASEILRAMLQSNASPGSEA